MRRILTCGLLVLSSCGSNKLADPEGVALNDVLQRIKTELGIFDLYEQQHASDPPLNNACKGYVNLHVTKVQMTLFTAMVTVNDGSVKIGLPVPTGSSLGLTAGGTYTVKNSENLVFGAVPNGPIQDTVKFRKYAESLDGI